MLIPEEIGQLSYLIELNISDNEIDSLPNTIGNLSHLEILNISDNAINQIPDSLHNLVNLTTLNVSGNQLDSLPSNWCEELQYIDWINLDQFNANDNNLCDEEKIPYCITIEPLNQNCD